MPGGGLEPEEVAADAAAREVLEEAGVQGQLGICLGIFEVIILFLEIMKSIVNVYLQLD